jgi:hypothetical protein
VWAGLELADRFLVAGSWLQDEARTEWQKEAEFLAGPLSGDLVGIISELD